MNYSLIFGGKDLTEFGIAWDGKSIFEKPAAVYTKYEIPFRNGDLVTSGNKFENVQITYRCYIANNYRENLSNLVNYLNSFDTYQRLENNYEDDIYRMAVFHSPISPENDGFALEGWVTLTFDCMPQEWLKSGEEEFSIDMQTNTYTGNPVTYEDGFGDSVVDSLTVEFEPQQDLHGYDYPWAGGAGKNKVDCAMLATVTNKGVTMYSDQYGRVYLDGTATGDGSFTLATNFRLPSGSYYLNGLADGAGMDSFYYTMSSGGAVIAYLSNDETVINGGTYNLYLNFVSGQVFNNTVFAPMIREVGKDPAFEPYSNICPITGHTSATVTRTGKNLYDISEQIKTSGNTYLPVSLKKNTVYTFSTDIVQRGLYAAYSDADEQPSITSSTGWTNITFKYNTKSITLNSGDHKWYRLTTYVTAGGNFASEYQLELGSTATEYELYTSNTYTIDLNGTVYGGTLDMVTGVLTVDRAKAVFSGSETWNLSGTNFFYTTKQSDFDLKDGSYMTENGITMYWYNNSKQIRVYLYNNPFVTTESNMNELLPNGMGVLYELATPTTVQLTPQQVSLLTGTNLFSSDVSDVAITITEGTTLNNPSYMKARPLIILNGSGTGAVMLNGEEVVRIGVAPSNVPLYIDCETMDCYSISNGQTVNENRHVTLPEGYIELQKGDNRFTASGNLEPTMIPRWWRL